MRTRTKASGYSLIELLVVVAIIGIMVAVAIPAITNWMRLYRLRAASQEVASELQRARLQAVMKTTNRGIVIEAVDSDTYRFINLDLFNSADPGLQAQAVGPLRQLPQSIVFDAAGVATPGTATSAVSFSRLGGACPLDSASCTQAADLPPCADVDCNDNTSTTDLMKCDLAGTKATTIMLRDSRYNLTRTVQIQLNGRISEQ